MTNEYKNGSIRPELILLHENFFLPSPAMPLDAYFNIQLESKLRTKEKDRFCGYITGYLGGYRVQDYRIPKLDEKDKDSNYVFGFYTNEESNQIRYEEMKTANSKILNQKMASYSESPRFYSQNPRRLDYYC